jgi:branched-chain amino acid transport system substrate-binding protein
MDPKPDNNETKQTPISFTKYGASLLHKWLVTPLIAGLIGTVILGRIVNGIIKPHSYYVYFVGPFDEKLDKTSPADDPVLNIWTALEAGAQPLESLDDVPIKLVRKNDFGDERTAERISVELAKRNDTLMVVGHLTSTTTHAALPAYLKQASPPIPVLLTTETNPDLLPPVDPNSEEYQPVYRLSPTDDQQARFAACVVRQQGAKAIWVVEAGPNRLYSRYLAQEFIQSVQENSPDSKVLLWSTSLDRPAVDAIEALKIDWIFYAGDWRNALVLLRQLKSVSARKEILKVILSDGAMDARLPRFGGQEVNQNVYLTFPIPFQRFHDQGGYAVYGKDARDFVTYTIRQTQANFDELAGAGRDFRRALNRILGLKRGADARNAIGSFMRRSAKAGGMFPLADKTNIKFDENGAAQNRSFSLWQIKNGAFAGAEQPPECSRP